jgi:hypothetical protein
MVNKKFPITFLVLIIMGFMLAGCIGGDRPARSYLLIDKVMVVDDVPYLHGIVGCVIGIGGCEDEGTNYYFVGSNFGQTWLEIETPPAELLQVSVSSVGMPKKECFRDNASICFRISSGQSNVQISQNGGVDWKIDWKSPPGRELYMERHSSFEGAQLDITPYDLGIFNFEGGDYVIIAMGNQGVMVRNSSGTWERFAVSAKTLSAAPIPYRTTDYKELFFNLTWEWLIDALICFLYFVLFSYLGIIGLHAFLSPEVRFKALFGYISVLALSVLSLLLLFDFSRGFRINFDRLYVCGLPFVGLALNWIVFILLSKRRFVALAIPFIPVVSTLILFIVLLIPFVLWGVGIIPLYEISFACSVISAIAIVYFSIRFLFRMVKQTQ